MKIIRILSLLVAILMVTTMLCACSGNSKKTADSQNSTSDAE